jgi:phage head maturation protease
MTATMIEQTIETRNAGVVADVNFPKRIVTCIAMPYEQPAEIYDGRRSFTEVVSREAFTGVERRASQIRANRDHSWDKLCGKVVALHPSRKEGLVAEVRMFGTDIGERTLVECDEGGLDASAGFQLLCRDDGRVYQDAEVWERNRTVRRLNRLRLEHLAFVPNPAYETAAVLSVRNAQEPPADERVSVSTPNLARLELDALRAAQAALDLKWLR